MVRLCGEEMTKPAEFLLLDHPAMRRLSVAPVFIAPHAESTAVGEVTVLAPRCVGVVGQTISDEAGGQLRRGGAESRRATPADAGQTARLI